MAKVSVTFTDSSDESVDTNIEFDPPIDKKFKTLTPAQIMALHCLETIKNHSEINHDKTKVS